MITGTTTGITRHFTEYCRLFCELRELVAAADDEGAEGESLRDEMDHLWQQLSGEDLDRFDALAFDLSRIGIVRDFSATVPAALNDEFKAILASGDREAALKFLRDREEHLPPHHVAVLRGMLWSDLGQHGPAAMFFSDALRLQAGNTQIQSLYLHALLKSRQLQRVRSAALRMVNAETDPLVLLLAADVLFDSLDWQAVPVPEIELRQVIELAGRGMANLETIQAGSWRAAIVSSALFSKALSHEILGETSDALEAAAQAEALISLPGATAVDTGIAAGQAASNGHLREQLQEARRLSHEAMEKPDGWLCAA